MPLPPPAARRHVHSRTVQCEGYFREDGLWDVEASLLDTKPFAHDDFERGRRQPGDAVHKMSIRLTVDDYLVVREAAAAMDDVPYLTCNDVPPRIEALVGLKLGGGWRAAVRARLEKRATCTHLMELIGPAIHVLPRHREHGRGEEELARAKTLFRRRLLVVARGRADTEEIFSAVCGEGGVGLDPNIRARDHGSRRPLSRPPHHEG